MSKIPGVVIIEGHVQGLANTRLLSRAGIPVIVVDKGNCIARYSKYCNRFYKCSDYMSDDFGDFLLDLHHSKGLQDWLLLPSNDHAVNTISHYKERLEKCYKVITEDPEVIGQIYNKRKLLKLAMDSGIPIPETVMPLGGNPESVELRYPILVKGNNGLSFYKRWHHKAILIKSEEELTKIWHGKLAGVKPEEYFIQEVLPNTNKTVSVAVFALKGIVYAHWMGVKLREHPLEFGTATCCQSVNDQEMLDLSNRLINKLNYTGVCEIEWIRDPRDNQPKLIEVNARTWLWVGLAAKCGVNFPLMIYEFIQHNKLPKALDYPTGEIWLNLYTDIFYSIKRIVRRINTPKEILVTYRKFTEACWDWHDPWPYLMYGILSFEFIRNR